MQETFLYYFSIYTQIVSKFCTYSPLCMLTPIYLIVLDEVSLIFSKQLKLYIWFQSFLQLLVRPPLFLIVILGNILFSFT
jgi:hypothetical protein